MRITKTTFVLAAALTIGGAWPAFAQYLNRTDTITTSAGDDQDVNMAIQTIDPWPRHVGNRRIPGNGERLNGAIQRYRSPGQGAGAAAAAPAGTAAAAGAASGPLPPTPSGAVSAPPATLPF